MKCNGYVKLKKLLHEFHFISPGVFLREPSPEVKEMNIFCQKLSIWEREAYKHELIKYLLDGK